jgi:allophanate hydrolase subunit 2
MDTLSLAAANLLVGNDAGAGVLEAVFMGPELEFTQDAMVAVTGADLPPKVDGQEQPCWTAFKVKKGQVLSFGFLKKGARGYIAVSGGIDVPVVLGSRSTYTLGALGGFEGRKLAAGDVLPVGQGAMVAEGRTIAEAFFQAAVVQWQPSGRGEELLSPTTSEVKEAKPAAAKEVLVTETRAVEAVASRVYDFRAPTASARSCGLMSKVPSSSVS